MSKKEVTKEKVTKKDSFFSYSISLSLFYNIMPKKEREFAKKHAKSLFLLFLYKKQARFLFNLTPFFVLE